MSFPYLLGAFSLLPILFSAMPMQAGGGEASRVQITILANEGILIRSGGSAVLIDAFVGAREAKGDSELIMIRADMLAGRPPFSSIDLALVSHPHPEHFDAATAGAFLRNHPETILASSSEITREIRSKSENPPMGGQLREIRWEEPGGASISLSDIRVEFIPFSHEASEFFPEQVLGHLIHLGGRKILIIGDAEMRPENWRSHDLKPRKIDIALVPYWLFKEEITRRIIDEHVAPETVAVVQVLPADLRTEVSELSGKFPDVVFLTTAMASAEL